MFLAPIEFDRAADAVALAAGCVPMPSDMLSEMVELANASHRTKHPNSSFHWDVERMWAPAHLMEGTGQCSR